MKKHLLLGLLAGMTAISASALDKGQYVYTNQGRFAIANAQNLYSGDFTNFTGWTVNSATEGTAISSIFTTETDETEGTFIKAATNAQYEGMSYTYTPSDPSATFVVSMRVFGTESATATPLSETHTAYGSYVTAGGNIIKIEGVNADTTVVLNSGLTLPAGWSTVAFGIVGSSDYTSYKITFEALNTSLEIANLQIQEAYQVADLHQRDAALKYADAFAKANPDAVTSDYTENYNTVAGISDESAQTDLDNAMIGLTSILDSQIKTTLDDQLAQTQSHFGIWDTKLQKQSTWGEWTCYPSGRGFCDPAGTYPHMGHFAGYYAWGGSTTGSPQGISMNIALQPGKYVFVTNAMGQAREKKSSSCWDVCTSLDYVSGSMFVVNAAGDTIATTGDYDVSPRDYTQGVLSFDVAEEGTYQVALLTYASAVNDAAMRGGALAIKDVEFYGKTSAQYSKLQETYYANVQTQVTAGRTALTTAQSNIDNAEYIWGKAALKEMMDTCEAKIKAYEDTITNKDAVIATMPEDYAGGTATISKGSVETDGMAYTAYATASKYVLDANTKFIAKNDTLKSLATAIASAKTILGKRLYETSTTKADFEAEIAKAESLNAEMLAADYSEENAAKIVAENAALEEAGNTFAASVPAENITDLVDIDFSNAATIAEEDKATAETADNTGVAATIEGKKGSMVFTNYSSVTPSTLTNCIYEIGIDNNGEKDSLGILRCGNGVATVAVSGAPIKSTDIVTVSFDYYIGNLSGKNAGYYLLSEEQDTICGLVFSKYSNTDVINTFAVDYTNKIAGVGSSAASNAAIAASSNATHFTVVLDYGRQAMYCTTSGSKGTVTTEEVELDINKKIGSFVLYTNYNNKDRRCWFDNLKIQNIAAGVDAGISNISTAASSAAAIYNIAGQKVGKNFKGIVIKNGQKYIAK